MIRLNGQLLEVGSFGDGTLKCNAPRVLPVGNGKFDTKTVTWCYDNDSEIFTLICLVDYLKDHYPNAPRKLLLPYIPHARQDREVSGRLFTLKSFAKIINSLDFTEVEYFDPHSDVSKALIDRGIFIYSPFMVAYQGYAVMYPDAGAAKKYGEAEGINNPIIGNKHRNEEGRITSYELLNFVEGTKKVIIRDDICSYGGTFVAAAKELRKRGVEEIILVVTHCENNILKGEVFDYIDRVFTTDSILTVSHPKITIARKFREESKNV